MHFSKLCLFLEYQSLCSIPWEFDFEIFPQFFKLRNVMRQLFAWVLYSQNIKYKGTHWTLPQPTIFQPPSNPILTSFSEKLFHTQVFFASRCGIILRIF